TFPQLRRTVALRESPLVAHDHTFLLPDQRTQHVLVGAHVRGIPVDPTTPGQPRSACHGDHRTHDRATTDVARPLVHVFSSRAPVSSTTRREVPSIFPRSGPHRSLLRALTRRPGPGKRTRDGAPRPRTATWNDL